MSGSDAAAASFGELSVQKIWSDIKNLLTAPLVGELDTVHLWALIGVVLISLLLWGFILRHIKLAAQEI